MREKLSTRFLRSRLFLLRRVEGGREKRRKGAGGGGKRSSRLAREQAGGPTGTGKKRKKSVGKKRAAFGIIWANDLRSPARRDLVLDL